MDAFLLDTTVLSICLDRGHPSHSEKITAFESLPSEAPKYVSVVAIAELDFGRKLAEALGKGKLPVFRGVIEQARSFAPLDLSHHTGSAYAELKSKLAVKYLAKPLRRNRPKYIEDWIDQSTGKALGIDENDLWMCAQAKERELIFVTADAKMKRIEDADSEVKLLVI